MSQFMPFPYQVEKLRQKLVLTTWRIADKTASAVDNTYAF